MAFNLSILARAVTRRYRVIEYYEIGAPFELNMNNKCLDSSRRHHQAFAPQLGKGQQLAAEIKRRTLIRNLRLLSF